ncbi:CYSTM domain-containing protein [Caenorhabditis elegans]|uniref:CYSTM domain-containing protein n=1 Tax=Caenorhabditis elegans TaxID=6239 RepID=Q9XX96_CAEEL|nr:CYSTM domain-containing protein [Caenorhabditis elegans]CAA20931.1 CYSTM domain-containing protein [Caenorhabditis elegans]|eukprot:NP_510352.1 Uncharacterized protein CELE_F28H6.7 [Caenorhabditis elegans]
MVNPSSYEPIVGEVYTAQPDINDSAFQAFGQRERQRSEIPYFWCIPCCLIIDFCACFVEVCGAVCACEEIDDVDD